MKDNIYAIAIHGGAGNILRKNITNSEEQAYKTLLNKALNTGCNLLRENKKAVDAVEAAVKIMENSPLFNAGKGSVFTNDGTNEMDAAIMDGKTRKSGAIAGVTTIKNPISLAKKIMEKSNHILLVGKGAEKFAKEHKIELVNAEYFFSQKRYNHYQKIKSSVYSQLDHSDNQDYKYGTVGAVALDKFGNLSAATSTGGMTNKKYGRVGDSPLIGAGTYANNQTCAVSCTGHGEYFIQEVVAYDIHALMQYKNMSLKEATTYVIDDKLKKMGGSGGVIAIDGAGNISLPFNTAGMYRAYQKSDGTSRVLIFED